MEKNENYYKYLEQKEQEDYLSSMKSILGDNYGKNIQAPTQTISPAQYQENIKKQKEKNEFGLMSIPKGVAGGVVAAGANTIELAGMVSNWLVENRYSQELQKYGERSSKLSKETFGEDNFGNQLVYSVSEFLTGFLPALKGVNAVSKISKLSNAGEAVSKAAVTAGEKLASSGTKLGAASGAVVKELPARGANILKVSTAGGVAGATTVSPESENMGNLLKTFGLEGEAVDYFAIDPNDSREEMKLKQFRDGFALGGLVDTAIDGVVLAFKAFKAAKYAKGAAEGKAPEEVAKEMVDEFTLINNKNIEEKDVAFQQQEKEIVAEKLRQIDEFSKISENNPLMADYQKSLAAKENKLFIAEVLTKENPTDEEIVKLSKIFEDIDEQSIQSVDKMIELKNYIKSEKDAGRNEIEALRAKRLNKIKALEEEAKRFEDELKFFEENLGSEDLIRARTQEQNINIAKKQLEEKIAAKQEQILIAKDEAERFKEFANKEKLIKEIAKSDLLTKEEKRYFDNIISQEAEVAAKNADAEFSVTKEMYNIAEETNFIEKNLNDYVRSNRAELSKGINDTLDNLKSTLSSTKGAKTEIINSAIEEVKTIAKSVGIELDDKVLKNAIKTIKEGDTKQITESLISGVEDTLKTATENKMRTSFKNQAGFGSGQMLAQIASAGAGVVGGFQTIDDNDSNAEKIMKILAGAGAGLGVKYGAGKTFEMVADRYKNNKMTTAQKEIFEKTNPATSSILKSDLVAKEVKPAIETEDIVKQVKVIEEEAVALSDSFINGKYTELTVEDFEKDGILKSIRNIETIEDVKKLVLDTEMRLNKTLNIQKAGDYGNIKTGTASWEQTRVAAEKIIENKELWKIGQITPKIHAQRIVETAAASNVQRIAQSIAELQAKYGTDPNFIKNSYDYKVKVLELENAITKWNAIYADNRASKAEIGRALNSLKMVVKEEEFSRIQVDELLTKVGGLSRMKEKIDALKDLKHPGAVNQALQYSSLNKTADWLMLIRTAGLLWSPSTQTWNIVSNTIKPLFTTAEKYIRAGYGTLFSKILSRNDVMPGYTFQEANAFAYGLGMGLKDGFRVLFKERGIFNLSSDKLKNIAGSDAFNDAMLSAGKTETQPSALTDFNDMVGKKFGEDSVFTNGMRWLGSSSTSNLKFMQKVDNFFQAISFRASLHEQAYRRAQLELQSAGIKQIDDKLLSQKINDLIQHPPADMVETAYKHAEKETFQNAIDTKQGKSFVDALASTVQNKTTYGENRGVAFMTKLIVPFVKTPTNILKQTLDRIPGLHLLVERRGPGSISAILGKQGAEAQSEAFARFTSGMLLMWAGSSMFDSDMISIEDGGKKVFLNAGDTKIDLSKVDPFGAIIGLSAFISQKAVEHENLARIDPDKAEEFYVRFLDMASVAGLSVMSYTANKSYMTGVMDFLDLINKVTSKEQDIEKLSDWIENQAATFIPFGAGLNFTRNLIDDKREADTIMEKIANKIPGLSTILDEKLDPITGEQAETYKFSGSIKTIEDDEVAKEFDRIGYRFRVPNKIQGIKLETEDRRRLIELATKEVTVGGSTLKEYLDEFVKSERYAEMIDGNNGYEKISETKYKEIDDIVNGYYRKAKDKLLSEKEELSKKIKLKKSLKEGAAFMGENDDFIRDAINNQ